MVGAGNDGQFKKFSAVLDEAAWSTSDQYSSNALRVANRTKLVAAIHRKLSQHTTAEWIVKFKGQGFPHAPVNDLKGTFAHPQALARGVVEEVVHPRAGTIKLVSPTPPSVDLTERSLATSPAGTGRCVRREEDGGWSPISSPTHPSLTIITQIRRPPPVLGEHTVEVLREELGYDDAQIKCLQDEGAI